LLGESHYIDVKREAGASPGARKETARDLASFAMDGGALLIGLEEDKPNRTWRPKPQPLAGLPERLEQIATTTVDPPLFIVTTVIPSRDDPSRGYVHAEVPPSASAPHMVEGVYYGRGDKTRVRLSDAQVVAQHARRESLDALVGRLLDDEVARDPVPQPEQETGRLYLVAQPLAARRGVARELARARDLDLRQELFLAAEHMLPGVLQQWAPSPRHASQLVRRAQGTAFISRSSSGAGRTFLRDTAYSTERDLLDMELREDGGLRVLMGRITDPRMQQGGLGEPEVVITEGLAVGYALRCVHWAALVGEATGYRGSWAFGMHAHGLRGHMSSKVFEDIWGQGDGTRYDLDSYREVSTSVHLEMLEQPWAVAERLVGRLVRGLGTEQVYGPALQAPQAAR
jgi:hypothetical protein